MGRRPLVSRWAAAVAVGIALAAAVPACGDRDAAGSAWEAIAPGPLSARDSTAAVWTGDELLVVGGVDWVCADSGDCAGPAAEEVLTDGAAYEPASDTWRELPDAPQGVAFGTASWTGDEMVVLAPELLGSDSGPVQAAATLALDPGRGEWRALDPPPDQFLRGGLWTGDRLVYWQSEESADASAWLLDPATGAWAALPADPFPATFDRSFGWTGDRLIMAALEVDDADEPRHFRIATLDLRTGTWDVWAESPVTFWAQEWFVFDGSFVNPTQRAGVGGTAGQVSGAVDLATRQWVDVAQVPMAADDLLRGCDLPAIGAAGDWLAGGGGSLVALEPADAVVVPGCAPLGSPTAAAWTGEAFVVWGGLDDSGRRLVASGLTWRPPRPGA